MVRWFTLLLAALFLGPSALAQVEAGPDCANPQSAADSLFVWQLPDRYDLERASACLEVPEGQSGERLAVQLKQVLDGRGLWVPVSALPTDPDYLNDDGEHEVVPMPVEAPWLVLEKRGDDWVYTEDTTNHVPNLYGETFSRFSQWFQSKLPDFFQHRVPGGMYLWQFAYAGLLLLASWLAGRIVHWLLRSQVRRWVRRAGLELDESTYARIRTPLVVLTMSGVILWGLPDLQLPISLSWLLHVVFRVVVAVAAVFVVSRAVDILAKLFEARADETESRLDDQVIPLLRQATQVVVWAVGILFVLQNQGVDVVSLVAGLGIGGLAFALAAKDTVANLFGSLNIFLDKPFQIGDAVEIGDVSGVVEEVGFRSTRVRTFYNSLVTIPNSAITNANVDNLGLRERRRVKVTLGLTYDTRVDTLQAFVEGCRGILASHPMVQDTYDVHFYNLGDSALEIIANFHVTSTGWSDELRTRSQVFMDMLRLAEDLGVSFAFPSTSVYLEATPDHPLAAREEQSTEELEQAFRAYGPGGDKVRPEGPRFTKSFSVGS